MFLYKDGCNHCRRSKEKLINAVVESDGAVYLVMKNVSANSKQKMSQWDVSKVPAVFVDGKRALGWEVPGFLNKFTENCGC